MLFQKHFLNIDGLYDRKRLLILLDNFNQTEDNSLFCIIKTKRFDLKVLRNTLYIHFDKESYINEYISRIFSYILKIYGQHLKDTKLHFSRYEYVPIE